jgi:SAM-dependent methyltransferase
VKTRKSASKSRTSKPSGGRSAPSPASGARAGRGASRSDRRSAPPARTAVASRSVAATAVATSGGRRNNGPRPGAVGIPEIPTTPLGPLAQAMLEAQAPSGQPVPHFPKDDYDYGWLHEFFAKPYSPKSCRAVVFGCGKGESSVHLSQRGFRVTGLDADRVAVGLARERAWLSSCDVDFMIGEIFETSALLPAESFGLSIDKSVFLALPGERERRRFLESVHRLLLPGGVLLLSATILDPERKPAKVAKPAKRRGKSEESLLVQEGGEVLGEILRAGFRIIERKAQATPAGKSELMVVCHR